MSDWMVRDQHGNVWPPGFRSELCDPLSPHSIMGWHGSSAARQAVIDARRTALEAGEGWARAFNGGVADGVGARPRAKRPYAFQGRHGQPSAAEQIWMRLHTAGKTLRRKGLPMRHCQSMLGLLPGQIRVQLRSAVANGVLVYGTNENGEEVIRKGRINPLKTR